MGFLVLMELTYRSSHPLPVLNSVPTGRGEGGFLPSPNENDDRNYDNDDDNSDHSNNNKHHIYSTRFSCLSFEFRVRTHSSSCCISNTWVSRRTVRLIIARWLNRGGKLARRRKPFPPIYHRQRELHQNWFTKFCDKRLSNSDSHQS